MKVSIAPLIVTFSIVSLNLSDAFSLRNTGGTHLTKEQRISLEKTAEAVASVGKGITACDEGPGTIGARFEAVGVENTEENRRRYRQMLFETPGCEDFLSAAILDPETLYQKSSTNGKSFPEVLSERGIVPGIKPHLKVIGSKISFCLPFFFNTCIGSPPFTTFFYFTLFRCILYRAQTETR
jgi:hypothetical protein